MLVVFYVSQLYGRILVIWKAQQKRGGDHEAQQGAIVDDDDDDDGCCLLFGVCQKESAFSPQNRVGNPKNPKRCKKRDSMSSV